MKNRTCRLAALAGAAALGMAALASPSSAYAVSPKAGSPIEHVVVIFGENISFDHYFATYPNAANIPGETQQGTGVPAPAFNAAGNTPKDIATLQRDGLLAPNNPNSSQPKRLTPGQAVTCDQDHTYTDEQKAYNGGKNDQYMETVDRDTCTTPNAYQTPGIVMDYYDGNTVTALWNYAQQYAMSDQSYSTVFGPSTPGALNLVSGQTHGVRSYDPLTRQQTATPDPYTVRVPAANGVGTVINDPDPVWDDCSSTKHPVAGMDGKNIGDMMNAKNVSWGWFQGGFRPTTAATATSRAVCGQSHTNVAGNVVTDYSPHHEPFQYYKSTANPQHLAPASTAEIGHNGQANHQYDLTDFKAVVNSDDMPAVSYLKAGMYQDGHAAYSDPIDEQNFIIEYVNMIQKSKNWKNTAIVLAYDDSDGWYDHMITKVLNASNSPDDAAWCKDAAAAGVPIAGGYQDRCGPGPRQPLLVVSPYAKRNFVDHTVTDQASILRFIEENWNLGKVGDHSADEWAGSMNNMFDFHQSHAPQVILNANGTVGSITKPDHSQGNANGKNKANGNKQGNDDARGNEDNQD